jgi:hypothetical protein
MDSHFPLPVAFGAAAFVVLSNGVNVWLRTRGLVSAGTVTQAEARQFVVRATVALSLFFCPIVIVVMMSIPSQMACRNGVVAQSLFLGFFLWGALWIAALFLWVRLGSGADYLVRFWPSVTRGGLWASKPATPASIRRSVSIMAAVAVIGCISAIAIVTFGTHASCVR